MFFIVIFICIAVVAGGSVLAGVMHNNTRRNNAQPAHLAQRGRKLSNREKLDMAKIAGVLPNRKEN